MIIYTRQFVIRVVLPGIYSFEQCSYDILNEFDTFHQKWVDFIFFYDNIDRVAYMYLKYIVIFRICKDFKYYINVIILQSKGQQCSSCLCPMVHITCDATSSLCAQCRWLWLVTEIKQSFTLIKTIRNQKFVLSLNAEMHLRLWCVTHCLIYDKARTCTYSVRLLLLIVRTNQIIFYFIWHWIRNNLWSGLVRK